MKSNKKLKCDTFFIEIFSLNSQLFCMNNIFKNIKKVKIFHEFFFHLNFETIFDI